MELTGAELMAATSLSRRRRSEVVEIIVLPDESCVSVLNPIFGQ
jgi:hypothetical protein